MQPSRLTGQVPPIAQSIDIYLIFRRFSASAKVFTRRQPFQLIFDSQRYESVTGLIGGGGPGAEAGNPVLSKDDV